jgi:hypothetical protein
MIAMLVKSLMKLAHLNHLTLLYFFLHGRLGKYQ